MYLGTSFFEKLYFVLGEWIDLEDGVVVEEDVSSGGVAPVFGEVYPAATDGVVVDVVYFLVEHGFAVDCLGWEPSCQNWWSLSVL